jgi:hypothetical protein
MLYLGRSSAHFWTFDSKIADQRNCGDGARWGDLCSADFRVFPAESQRQFPRCPGSMPVLEPPIHFR